MSLSLCVCHLCVCTCVLCDADIHICWRCVGIFFLHKCTDMCIYIHVEAWLMLEAFWDHWPSYLLRSSLSMEPRAQRYWKYHWPVCSRDPSLCILSTWITVSPPMDYQPTVPTEHLCSFWDPISGPHMLTVRALTTHQSLQLKCDFCLFVCL